MKGWISPGANKLVSPSLFHSPVAVAAVGLKLQDRTPLFNPTGPKKDKRDNASTFYVSSGLHLLSNTGSVEALLITD